MLGMLLLAISGAQAASICSAELIAATAIKLQHDPTHTRLQRCDPLPGSTDRALMLFGYRNDGKTDEAYFLDGSFDLDLVIVGADGKVKRYLRDADTLHYADPTTFAHFSVDKTPYQLASDVRAYGVRDNSLIHTHIVDMEDEFLRLYVDDGKTLRPVLDRLPMNSLDWRSMDCDGGATRIVRSIKLAATISHGLRDLILLSRKVVSVSVPTHDDGCDDKLGKPTFTRHLLRYDGRQYVIPATVE